MQPEDVRKETALAKVIQLKRDSNKKSDLQRIRFKYALNGTEIDGETQRIYCPGTNHKILIPLNSFFALILPECQSFCIPRDASLIQSIACTQFSESEEEKFAAFVFKTTQKIGVSQIYFQDFNRLEAFDVTIINSLPR